MAEGIGVKAHLLLLHLRIERLAVDERVFAILLAVEVGGEVEYVVGRVLVHRRVGRRAYEDEGVAAVAYEDHRHAPSDEAEHAYGHRVEEICPEEGGQHYEEDDAERYAVAYPEHTREGHGEEEGDAYHVGAALLLERIERPHEGGHDGAGVDEGAGVEAHSAGVDEEELKLLCHLNEARHEAVKHEEEDGEGDEKRAERLLEVHVVPFAVGEYEHNRRDAEEVEEMDRDADADDVGYQDEVAVGVRLVGAVLPLQDEPEDEGRAERRERVDLSLDG